MIPINTGIVSAVVLSQFDNTTKMLLLKRAKEGYWCHIAGKIEPEEAGWQAIVRECLEETHIKVSELYNGEYQEQFYEPAKNQLVIIPCFAIYCPENQAVTLNWEHTEYRWCTLDEAKALVPFPNQRALYDHIWSVFVDNKPSEFMRIILPE